MKTPKPMLVIAEVKTQSPFGWKSSRSWDDLFEIACRVGDCISIHTDPRWGGSMDLVRRARSMTNKLIPHPPPQELRMIHTPVLSSQPTITTQ